MYFDGNKDGKDGIYLTCVMIGEFYFSKKFFTVQSGWTTSNRVILQQLCRKTWHLT